MEIPFTPSPAYTLGVEWELALVAPDGGGLVSVADRVFARLGAGPRPRATRAITD